MAKSEKKTILDLNHEEAKEFFLRGENYCTLELPSYFVFDELLKSVSKELDGKKLTDFYKDKVKPQDLEDVNYKLFNNKDGEYSWRLLQLIHPAIYVSLVHQITKKEHWDLIIGFLKKRTCVECVSLPVVKREKHKQQGEQILHWWKNIEQKSIQLALEYDYILNTDIVDCYGSIYTHAIPWALHTKEKMKKKENRSRDKKEAKKFIGNIIDWHLQDMSHGQTNGIPQGSVLMDFIAEIVLKYIDDQLTIRLKKKEVRAKDFKILRYRDDYRIFVNSTELGKEIIKELSIILSEMGMRLNTEKTFNSDDVISSSIKPDKLFSLIHCAHGTTDSKKLLAIRELSIKYKNSGTLVRELESFYQSILTRKKFGDHIKVLVSIVTDIAIRNPRTYPIAISIIGKVIDTLDDHKVKIKIIETVEKKIKRMPNTEIVDLWLQRLTIKFQPDKHYSGKLTKKVIDKNTIIWNSEWLTKRLRSKIESIGIVNYKEIECMPDYPDPSEVSLFEY